MARAASELKAVVVGTGFIGLVHVEALRRLGVEVVGVVGSTPERARAKAHVAALPPAYPSFEAALGDARVDVVHLATPNDLHHAQAKAVLEAGKHVVCEKPLALTSTESAELAALAHETGLVAAVNFMARFYPQCQEARSRVAAGELGEIWNVHGSYLQDWLLFPTDWNWRLEPQRGGPLRAVADIGAHWLDLVQFVTGRQVVSVFADLATFLPTRRRPAGPVETFGGSADADGVDTPVETEDAAHVLVRFEGGARGAVVISQVSAGRKNALSFEIDGSGASLAWSSVRPEELWLGRRDRANELLVRDPSLLGAAARGTTTLPGGHPEGFAETFKELYRAVYRAAAAGEPGSDYPTFDDGHAAVVLGEAIAESSREGRWVDIGAAVAVRAR